MSDAELYELRRRTLALERRLDALDGGTPAASGPEGDAELERLVSEGSAMLAIVRYRDLTGVGMAEARTAVDALMRG
ncbi:hypothetical protein [Nocardioides renjunii]|uniref:hypothetical protein n=1 Tax=Nocardioides renjunii TaxID=3095075 RepID=UPI002AFEC3CC|nr:hypothetical protein [Nocardioides sp. S-34]WQQ21391.1 hypothetical protein SHK17_16015 [Nocardioides sp. S-34]